MGYPVALCVLTSSARVSVLIKRFLASKGDKRFPAGLNRLVGSWLDLAESELAVLTSQCLDRRIPNHKTLIREVSAWVKHRNLRHAKADWRFTTDQSPASS